MYVLFYVIVIMEQRNKYMIKTLYSYTMIIAYTSVRHY